MADSTFTDERLADLLALARSLTEYVPPERVRSAPSATAAVNGVPGDRPGDVYNRSASWDDVLQPHGWVKVRQFDRHAYWRRPGKDRGISATTDYCRTEAQGGLLYVFTSSAAPLEMDTAYSKFAAFTVLNHGGDFERAAEVLKGKGYGGDGGTFRFDRKVPAGRAAELAAQETEDGLALTCLTAIKGKPIRWLVPGYIPRGKSVLWGGDGGHGKSAGSLHLAACVTTGRPAFGLRYEAPPPGEVLLVSCEDDYSDTVLPRLLAAGADLSRVFRVDGVKARGDKPLPFSLAHYLALGQELARRPAVRLVVIDPAGSFVGRARVDDHKNAELRALLDPLSELAARYEVCILIITHLNKAAAIKAVNRISGSNAYVNAVRAAYLLAPDPDDAARKLFMPIKFNLGPWPAALAYRPQALPHGEAVAITVSRPFADLTADDRDRVAQQLFRIDWMGAVDVQADDVMVKGSHLERGPTKVQECEDWLRSYLEFSRYDDEIQRESLKKGFKPGTLKQAKASLRKSDNLNSIKEGFGGKWLNGFGDARSWQRAPTDGENDRNGENGENARMDGGGFSFSHSRHSGHSGHPGHPGAPDVSERVYRLLWDGDVWAVEQIAARLNIAAADCAAALELLTASGRVEPRGEPGQFAAVRHADADTTEAIRNLILHYLANSSEPVSVSRLSSDTSIDPLFAGQCLAALTVEGKVSASAGADGPKTYSLNREEGRGF